MFTIPATARGDKCSQHKNDPSKGDHRCGGPVIPNTAMTRNIIPHPSGVEDVVGQSVLGPDELARTVRLHRMLVDPARDPVILAPGLAEMRLQEFRRLCPRIRVGHDPQPLHPRRRRRADAVEPPHRHGPYHVGPEQGETSWPVLSGRGGKSRFVVMGNRGSTGDSTYSVPRPARRTMSAVVPNSFLTVLLSFALL